MKQGNTTVVLSTPEYKQQTAALLDDPAYQKLTRHPTASAEWKTRLFLKK
jgi:hypothetical protein